MPVPATDLTEVPHGTILHHIPGRLRLRVAAARARPAYLHELIQTLNSVEGVRQVTPNPVTGSLIIFYDPGHFGRFPARLAEAARRSGLLTMGPGYRSNPDPDATLTKLSLERA